MHYDFSGWATVNDLKCSDGRIIRRDAFKDCDGDVVPLVWNHQHNDVKNILGHALLKNRDKGVYSYCTFNDTESGRKAKEIVANGDISSLSIYANQLKHNGANVTHGMIREVSLVLAGANPGAHIDYVLAHSEDGGDSAIIFNDMELDLEHSDEDGEDTMNLKEMFESMSDEEKKSFANEFLSHADEKESADSGEKTLKDVFDTLTEEQKDAVYAIIGLAMEDANGEGDEEGDEESMKHNVFDNEDYDMENTLSHAEMDTIISDAKKFGSLKESFLAHADEYGIENIDYLFPDARNYTDKPEFIKRDTDWVSVVMNGTHHTPFSRIKSMFADITEDEARAKGYIKGNRKTEEVFSLLKRTTTPTTIYKKQKLDRDDVIDITDFDVIAWLKSEMRMMLDEELARAFLVGDGRLASSDDKINEQNIRPIAKDDSLYTIQATFDGTPRNFIEQVIRTRKDYKGSGTPMMFTTETQITDCLLMTDTTGRDLYDSIDKLATKLRVSRIVTVPDEILGDICAIVVNLNDYNVGADKGGAINMFDDFDIDYNQQKYLIETRCSGALVKPYSAMVFKVKASAGAGSGNL